MKASFLIRGMRERAIQLDKQFEAVKSERDAVYLVIGMLEREIALETDSDDTSATRTYTDTLTDAIVEVLETEQPLHRNVILERVQDKGVHVAGVEPVKSLGAHLSADPRFKNVSRGVWALVGYGEDQEEDPHNFLHENPDGTAHFKIDGTEDIGIVVAPPAHPPNDDDDLLGWSDSHRQDDEDDLPWL